MSGVFRFLTAGESHGEAPVAVVDGVPAGAGDFLERFARDGSWRSVTNCLAYLASLKTW